MAPLDPGTLRAAIRAHGTEDVDTLLAALSADHPSLDREGLLAALDELADAGGMFQRAAPPAEPAFGRRQFLATAFGGAALSAAFASTASAAVVCATEPSGESLAKLERRQRSEETAKVRQQQAAQPKQRVRDEARRKRQVAEEAHAEEMMKRPDVQKSVERRAVREEEKKKREVHYKDYRLDEEERIAWIDFPNGVSIQAGIKLPLPSDVDTDCSFRLDVRVDGMDGNPSVTKEAQGYLDGAVKNGDILMIQHGAEGEQILWAVATGMRYAWMKPNLTGDFQELCARLDLVIVDPPAVPPPLPS